MTTSANAPFQELANRYPMLGKVWAPYWRRVAGLRPPDQGFIWMRRLFAEGSIDDWADSLSDWEQAAALVDPESSQVLQIKFLNTVSSTKPAYRQDYNDAFLEVISEMLGYAWLIKTGVQNVRFISPGRYKEPDLVGLGNVVMECKHVRPSDFEKDYFANHQFEARSVSPYAPENLLAKAERTLQAACQKFNQYPTPHWRRYVFLDLSLDTQVRLHQSLDATVESQIAKELHEVAEQNGVGLVVIKFMSLRTQLWPPQA
jgi:hypothetical protein